jgi:hypothetical protein
VITDFQNDIPGENFHVDQTIGRFDSRIRPVADRIGPRAKGGRLLCGQPGLLPGQLALLPGGEGRLLPKGAKVLHGRQGLLQRRSQEWSEGFDGSRRGENLFVLLDDEQDEGRRAGCRLLQSEARLLRRKVGLLLGQPQARMLPGGGEMLRRKQELLHGSEMTH